MGMRSRRQACLRRKSPLPVAYTLRVAGPFLFLPAQQENFSSVPSVKSFFGADFFRKLPYRIDNFNTRGE